MEMIKVLMMDLPHSVRGVTAYYFADDGLEYYTILLNSRMSYEAIQKAYDHEIRHINNGDFDEMVSVNALEEIRHIVAV